MTALAVFVSCVGLLLLGTCTAAAGSSDSKSTLPHFQQRQNTVARRFWLGKMDVSVAQSAGPCNPSADTPTSPQPAVQPARSARKGRQPPTTGLSACAASQAVYLTWSTILIPAKLAQQAPLHPLAAPAAPTAHVASQAKQFLRHCRSAMVSFAGGEMFLPSVVQDCPVRITKT
jgi:hypothetical protein